MKKIIPTILCLIFLSWLILNSIKFEPQRTDDQIYYIETYTAQINGRDTTIHIDQQGNMSARIEYAYCEPLSFMDDCRWDREIINIIF